MKYSLSGHPELDKYLKRLVNDINAGFTGSDPEGAAAHAGGDLRMVLEYVTGQYMLSLGENSRMSTFEQLKRLENAGRLDRDQMHVLHGIRKLGNREVHEAENGRSSVAKAMALTEDFIDLVLPKFQRDIPRELKVSSKPVCTPKPEPSKPTRPTYTPKPEPPKPTRPTYTPKPEPPKPTRPVSKPKEFNPFDEAEYFDAIVEELQAEANRKREQEQKQKNALKSSESTYKTDADALAGFDAMFDEMLRESDAEIIRKREQRKQEKKTNKVFGLFSRKKGKR